MVLNFSDPTLFYILFTGIFLTCRIPIIGTGLKVVNTMLHESAHGLVAFCFSGKIQSIKLFSNTEGEITVKGSGRFATFLTAIAGYPLSAASGMGLLFLISEKQTELVIWILSGVSILILVLFIRNWFGAFWLIGFAAINGALIYFKLFNLINLACYIYVFVIITEAIYSPFAVFYLSFTNPKAAGDASVLSKITHIHPVFWGLVFTVGNGFILYYTIINFFPFPK